MWKSSISPSTKAFVTVASATIEAPLCSEPPRLMFLKGYTSTGFAEKVKAKLRKGFEQNKDGYTDAKATFIRTVTAKARKL